MSQIDRLTRRVDALQAQRKPPEQRVFTVLVRNHMRTDAEIARFCAEHGVTDSDLLIAQILSRRARAKPQKMPTNASCAPWQETMTMGAKAKRRCRILLTGWPWIPTAPIDTREEIIDNSLVVFAHGQNIMQNRRAAGRHQPL